MFKRLSLAGALVLSGACAPDEPRADLDANVESDAHDLDSGSDIGSGADASADATPDTELPPVDQTVAVDPPEPQARRLTRLQYAAAIHMALGEQIVVPAALEPDLADQGFFAIGASTSSISPRGVEQYETAAFAMAAQFTADPDAARTAMGCDPVTDSECTAAYFAQVGRLLWRRPLTSEELDRAEQIATEATTVLGTPWAGVEYGLAYLLQAPDFIYRVELGTPESPSGLREATGLEMASRLAFFLWNSPPDAELLAAGERGDLTDPVLLEARVDAMLADPRAREGVRNYFYEMLGLSALDRLSLDPTLFVHFGPDVGPAAREETLLNLEYLVFELDADYRDIFVTTSTFINRKLASIYSVPAPSRDGFALTELPADGGRRGLLGQAAVLALTSHPVSTSATLRGKYIRQTLLCGTIQPPPVNANTALPEPSGTTRTLRERVAEHLQGESCTSCHLLMDPIGLGLENFDAIGRWRTTDNGGEIDPSGDLDGTPFNDAWDLGQVLRDHPDAPRCLVRGLYRYSTGRLNELSDRDQLEALEDYFAQSGFRVRALVRAIALSPGFRRLGAVEL